MSFLGVAENSDLLDPPAEAICAPAPPHIWIKFKTDGISEADDGELKAASTAADQQARSHFRLPTVITEIPAAAVVEVPKWNRNATHSGKT